ncbi:MAG: roadblock/LC7 domain-containing protein [Methanoregulaceae archaeon]|jgi:predicted regulator of Ras-like GTPase activity (Roadblock/LC7/MglB family)
MELPSGTPAGVITNSQEESAIQQLMTFHGAIEIDTQLGHGFILTNHGTLVAAYFKDLSGSFRGKLAVDHMGLVQSDDVGYKQTFTLRSYNDDEFLRAKTICDEERLLISEKEKGLEGQFPNLLDETQLKKILSLPGVVAISVFFEGFSVQSLGDADFEHVAALAEDLLRAGTKITLEMNMGNLDQLILETATNKIIIAPCGDLFICVYTHKDAHLGLLRVAIKNLQSEQNQSHSGL